MVKGYYRMISGIDREIGKLRAFLDDLGIADNTVIILMGDNGYFLGERQFAGKWLMYENSLRVPLIIYDPSRNKLPEVSDYLALNLDIAPTILDFAGMEIPSKMQGVSLKYEGMDAKSKLIRREDFLCEHLFNHPNIPKSEGIRTKNMKYFRYIDHPEDEELYNLESDPMEIINLAEEKKYMKEVEKLRSRLDELIKEYDK
jgi:arylsulfatase A-like enzyme